MEIGLKLGLSEREGSEEKHWGEEQRGFLVKRDGNAKEVAEVDMVEGNGLDKVLGN